jgi:hypothetical protein
VGPAGAVVEAPQLPVQARLQGAADSSMSSSGASSR